MKIVRIFDTRIADALGLLALSVLCFGANAADVEWIGVNGAWEVGTNWSTGNSPLSVEEALIAAPGNVSSNGLTNEAKDLELSGVLEINAGLLDILGVTLNSGMIKINGGHFETNFLTNEGAGIIDASGSASMLRTIVEFENAGSLTIEDEAKADLAELTNLDTFFVKTGARVDADTMVNDIGATTTVQNSPSILAVADNTTNAGNFSVLDGAAFTTESFVNYSQTLVEQSSFGAESVFNAALGIISLTGASAIFTVDGNITNQGGITTSNSATANIVSIGNENSLTILSSSVVNVISILNTSDADILIENSGSRLALSDNLQSSGNVEVDDEASLGALSIGNSGTLTVRNGASIDTESVENTDAGTIEVSGTTSAMVLSNNFTNAGSVELNAGALVTAGSYVNNGTSSIVGGSRLGTTTLINHAGGDITLSEAGTLLDVSGVFENRGTLNVNAGTIAKANTFDQVGGATHLDDGTLQSNGGGISISGGTLSGMGIIDGDLAVLSAGRLLAGDLIDPTSVFNVTGATVLQGSIEVDIEGLLDNEFDRLLSTGPLSLGGMLKVSLLGGFLPQLGDIFEIATASAVSGDFATTLFPVFDGRTFDLFVDNEFVQLRVTAANAVPIPPAIVLLAPALFAALRRRAERG